jgi:Zn-dependent protease
MDQNTKRTLWIVGGAVLLIALVAHHNITREEIIFFLVVIPSIILHEVSHGWVARFFGDDTAARAGRLSLNPLVHVDPVGTLIVPAVMVIASAGVFGWAKPVPVNTARLRSPRNQGVLVSLAGPATNVVLAAVAAVVFIKFSRPNLPAGPIFVPGSFSLLAEIVYLFGLANVGLAIFNMIPLPPLDGSVLFERLLPARYWPTYLRIRPYTMAIIMGLVLLNFYLQSHGPITVAFAHVDNWWAHLLVGGN